jgi:hypothetical protein
MNNDSTKQFFEKNDFITNHRVNKTLEELLCMDDAQFREWVIEMRRVIIDSWDKYGCPARAGKSEQEIIDIWNKMATYPVHKFAHSDELSNVPGDVIINKSRLGSEADQFFPNMMKTRINYTDKDTGYSIYDLFARDDLLERMVKGCKRHFRRDSFYHHAMSVIRNDDKTSIVRCETGREWVDAFFDNQHTVFNGKDFFLEKTIRKDGNNTGYVTVDLSKILHLTRQEVLDLKEKGILQYKHYSTFDVDNMSEDAIYNLRMYDKGKKIFPKGFMAFRIGYIQMAVNFPPMTAKYLYQRFTDHCKHQPIIRIYDPSSGWGGRILGAMAVSEDRKIHYIGTDPNPDNHFDDGTSRYSLLADFYNEKTYRSNPFFSNTNTYEIYKHGSEVIRDDPNFIKHKGLIDMVFTSPPYFNREAYSEDENQSYKKYGSSYDDWRDNFLRPTLETAVEWLRPGGYLLWNIADILVKNEYLSLEQDSKDILLGCGMEYQYVLKMAMENMPGQNRLDENGVPKCKNYCKVNGKYMKYEPVFVFRKPA